MFFYISRRQIAKMIEGARFFPTIIHIVASNKLGIRTYITFFIAQSFISIEFLCQASRNHSHNTYLLTLIVQIPQFFHL